MLVAHYALQFLYYFRQYRVHHFMLFMPTPKSKFYPRILDKDAFNFFKILAQ